MKRLVLALVAVAMTGSAAHARECQVTVLRQVTDDIGNVWKPGTLLPVDVARDGPDGGAYCAHGGGCMPRRADGRQALRLDGCRIGRSLGDGDRLLVPVPAKR